MFTSEEYTEMMIIYGESGSNSKAVARFPTENELVVLTARFALLMQKESYFNNSRKMEREVLEMWPTS
jgi:hypothetical protein